MSTVSGKKLQDAVEILLKQLEQKEIIALKSDKERDAVIVTITQLLENTFEGNVPHDVFKNPAARQGVYAGIIAAVMLVQKPELKLENRNDLKELSKNLLTLTQKISPKPKKDISDDAEKLTEIMAPKPPAPTDKIQPHPEKKTTPTDADDTAVDERFGRVFELAFAAVFGATSSGQPVVIQQEQGNYQNIANIYQTFSAKGGFIHEASGLTDGQIDPTLQAAAQERMGGLEDSTTAIALTKMLDSTPQNKPYA